MSNLPLTARLRDGSPIEIRPIRPDDRERLRDGFARLSTESRYRRFFGPMPELSDRELDYLTQVDHHSHEALVALDTTSGDGVGVARFVKTAPTVAEPAMAVVDDWQGRGVGSALLDALAQRATEEGVERFEAPVLATNTDAIRVLERLGQTTRRRDGREIQLTIELPAAAPAALRRRALLRYFAVGLLEPARTVIERLWTTRQGSPGDPRLNVIVVGTDGSEDAVIAVEKAADLALASGARVEVVGAHRFLGGDSDDVAVAVGEAVRTLEARGVEAEARVRRGDPALVLTDIAFEQNARLIVVGAGRRSKNARRIIGSVADAVSARSPCDVLIVRLREAAAARD